MTRNRDPNIEQANRNNRYVEKSCTFQFCSNSPSTPTKTKNKSFHNIFQFFCVLWLLLMIDSFLLIVFSQKLHADKRYRKFAEPRLKSVNTAYSTPPISISININIKTKNTTTSWTRIRRLAILYSFYVYIIP